jgi:L-arabinonolactonase
MAPMGAIAMNSGRHGAAGAVCVVDCKNQLAEGPLWDPIERSLFWVDIPAGLVQRFDPASGARAAWTLPEGVGALALREKGGLVVALASGFALFDPASGALRRLASPEAGLPDNRMNDGKCDRRGRFWAGTMNAGADMFAGSLYRLDADLSFRSMAGGIGISNGPAWSPDDLVFYFADSRRRLIYAYDFDLATGAIANRRVFADCSHEPFEPDGATIDEEGCLWSAQWNGWRIVRYTPDGGVDRIVEMPVQRPTSCMFGGPNLGTLYVTSARIGLTDEELAAQPQAGGVFALDVGVRGLPAFRFAG